MAALLEMLTKQRLFMQQLGVLAMDPKVALLQASIGLSCESAEVLSLLNKFARPWKPSKIDLDHTIEETTDVMFFALELFNLFGLTEEDVLNEYNKKLLINFARIIGSIPMPERKSYLYEIRREGYTHGYDDNPKIATMQFYYPFRQLLLSGVLNPFDNPAEDSEDDVRFLADPVRFTRERVNVMWPSSNWKDRLPDNLK